MPVNLLYAFPEPLPLGRARGIQTAHAVSELANLGFPVQLAYVPNGEANPLTTYGVKIPASLSLSPISRSLPWPFHRVHSNKIFWWNLRRILRDGKERFVYVRHLKLAAMLAGDRKRPQFAYEAHEVFGDTANPDSRDEQAAMETLVMARASLVVANSRATARRLCERYGNRRVEVVQNAVEWPTHIPTKDWARAGEHIAYAGSFFGWKGVSDLVAASEMLAGCRVTLIGGSASEMARERACVSKGGAELVFLGQMPHAEVAGRLASSCIAVLPNRDAPESRFTSPIKLFEYMASGCAMVVSDLPALREVLGEDDAVWVRAGDPSSLASGIMSLVNNPDRARVLGERGRMRASQYTWRARAERVVSLISSVCGKRRIP